MISALQIIDTLHTGGAERLAVNYANGLKAQQIESHICVTRSEGPLLQSIDENVGYIFLNRKSTIDLKAIFKLRSYIRKHKINVIHAHASSFFIATLVKLITPGVKLFWHDHYGNSEFLEQRPKGALKFCSLLFTQIFSVNNTLESWAKHQLWCKKVAYIKNFPVLKETSSDLTQLKGENDKRLLCLANLREQKNHIGLLKAFKEINSLYPDWTLHCVGKDFKDDYSDLFFLNLKDLGLENHAFFYDTKTDILNILQQGTIGLLVSKSEGLPLALLEYGLAGLPVVCTNVGDCGKVISSESHGILLNDDKTSTIITGISKFIEDEPYRKACGKHLKESVNAIYSEVAILSNIAQRYRDSILN